MTARLPGTRGSLEDELRDALFDEARHTSLHAVTRLAEAARLRHRRHRRRVVTAVLCSAAVAGLLGTGAMRALEYGTRSDVYASAPSATCPDLSPGFVKGGVPGSGRAVSALDLRGGWVDLRQSVVPTLGGRGFSDRGTTTSTEVHAMRQADGLWSVGQVISTIPEKSDATAAYAHSVETLKCQPTLTLLTAGVVDGAEWTLASFRESPTGSIPGQSLWIVARSGDLVSSLVLTSARFDTHPASDTEAGFVPVSLPDTAWVRSLAQLAARRLAGSPPETPLPPLGRVVTPAE